MIILIKEEYDKYRFDPVIYHFVKHVNYFLKNLVVFIFNNSAVKREKKLILTKVYQKHVKLGKHFEDVGKTF